jgi:hypothetical protein
VAAQLEVRIDIEIERQRGHDMPGGEREMLDHGLRQHGDLAARHVDRGQARTGDLPECRIGCDAEARCGDVDTDAQAAVRADLDGEGIIDFGGMRVVDGEGTHLGDRQAGGFDRVTAGSFAEIR